MKFVPAKVTRTIGRQVLLAKKNSPHFFFAAGVVGVLGGTFLACRATLKLEESLDEIKTDLDKVKEIKKNAGPEYSDRDHMKDLGYVYSKSAIKLGKLYGPSIIVGGVSIASLTGSHVQLVRRNVALSSTLALVSKAYENYRIRVQEEIGKDRELEIHRGITTQQLTIDGKKELVKVTDPNGWSPYARIFDETTEHYQKNAEYNRIFIQCQQNYLNHLLHARGHVFLNEVYDALGFERSQAGQVVGWITNGEGDGFIDFGLFEATSNRFINGIERAIILDFNVDGVIYDKI